jgi:hypothetical protein
MTSAILTKLAETYPEVLTNSESILGPNHLKVLEFWRFLDSLNDLKKDKIAVRYCDLDYDVRNSAIFAACDAVRDVVGVKFRIAAWNAAYEVTKGYIFGYATWELVGNLDNKVFYDLIMSYKQLLGISLTHSVFLRKINDKCEGSPQDVLSNPAKYLGPNFEQVLDFWIYLDSLSDEGKEEMWQRYLALDSKVRLSARISACDAATEVVGEKFSDAAWDAAYDVTGWFIFGDATYELVGNLDNKVFYDLIMSHKKP